MKYLSVSPVTSLSPRFLGSWEIALYTTMGRVRLPLCQYGFSEHPWGVSWGETPTLAALDLHRVTLVHRDGDQKPTNSSCPDMDAMDWPHTSADGPGFPSAHQVHDVVFACGMLCLLHLFEQKNGNSYTLFYDFFTYYIQHSCHRNQCQDQTELPHSS